MVDTLAKEVEKEKMKVRLHRILHCLSLYARSSLLGDSHIVEFIITFFIPFALENYV